MTSPPFFLEVLQRDECDHQLKDTECYAGEKKKKVSKTVAIVHRVAKSWTRLK